MGERVHQFQMFSILQYMVKQLPPKYEEDTITQYWVIATRRCDLDLWPFDLVVMSRDST